MEEEIKVEEILEEVQEEQPVEETEDKKKKSEKQKESSAKLKKQIAQLQEVNMSQELENKKLKFEIYKLNKEYVDKLKEKATEAQVKLKEKMSQLQERNDKELEHQKKYAISKKMDGLLNTLKMLEMAVDAPSNSPEVSAYKQGFGMVVQMYKGALEDLGIIEINVKPGDEFDHNTMQATEQVAHDNYETNKVVRVLTKGYRLHDRVLIPVNVVVSE